MFSICDNRSETRLKETDYQWVDYDGIVWCANNVNTTVIVRRNGKVSIQGNCNGCAADIVGTPNTPKENKRLFNLIQELKLPFDQVIDEKKLLMGTRQPPKRRQQEPSIETLKSKHHGSRNFII